MTTETNVNVELLDKAVGWATKESKRGSKSRWYQGMWWTASRDQWREFRKNGFVKHLTNEQLLEGDDAGEHYWVIANSNGADVLSSDRTTCGTTGCIAGYVTAMNRDEALVFRPTEATPYNPMGPEGGVRKQIDGHYVLTTDGKIMEVDQRARELLGITSQQARRLFSSGNSIEDVQEFADRIKAGDSLDYRRNEQW